MIEGVLVVPLRQIADHRGRVMHMLRRDDPHFEQFGEIYFSVVYPDVVKAWHCHSAMALNYAVVSGNIQLVLFDDRAMSPTRGEVVELFPGEANYCLVRVPPGVWNGFRGLGVSPSIVANCATLPHDPQEIVRLHPTSSRIPYEWSPRRG